MDVFMQSVLEWKYTFHSENMLREVFLLGYLD